MRVPTLTATAGYAAPTHHFDVYLNEQYFDVRQSTTTLSTTATPTNNIERNKNNGNIDLLSSSLNSQHQHQTPIRTQHTNEFVSSADEFVQRALNSAPSTNYKDESNFEFLRACSDNKDFNNSDINSSPTEPVDANQYNTYRSFKDAFNVNRIFYEECARNLDDLNVHDPHDIDPIQVINSSYTDDDITEKDSTTPFENMKTITQAQQDAIHNKEINVNETESYLNGTKDTDLFNDNDYDDHAMLDLCSETNDDEDVKEFIDRDAYLTSPTSSSISDHAPKRTFSYFPRGIINPNYPGFQHLAHTLTEHFITGTSASDSYDSDFSEYEMELSADSFEDLTDEATEQLKLKLNRFNNNFGDQQLHSTMHPDELLDVELRETQQTLPDVYDDAFISDSVENATKSKAHGDDNCNMDLRDLPSSLRTTLTLIEPARQLDTTVLEQSVVLNNEEKAKIVATPPDILMKNGQSFLHVNTAVVKKENRPDLLYGVSPQHLVNGSRIGCEETQDMKTEKKKLRVPTQLAFDAPVKDEISMGVTPVDIIGDFGQEVEREFGLLVSGYRRLTDAPTPLNETVKNEQSASISKHQECLIDAELSNVSEEIDAKKYLTALNLYKECEERTSKDLKSPNLHKRISAITECDFIEDNNAVDWSTAAHENEIDKPHNTTPIDSHSNSGTNEALSTIFINDYSQMDCESKSDDCINSTKPKYQKSSYDERQLPPVAIEYKRCQQPQRSTRKPQLGDAKVAKSSKKSSFANRILHSKRSVFKCNEKPESNIRKREEAEIHQYQQLISDKESILSNSRYTKLSSWAQYLKSSVQDKSTNNSTELISPSALELFDAYKVGGEVDRETLQKHLKMAKEIEKKRRSDREEIRRRLAMGAEENSNAAIAQPARKLNLQSTLHNGLYVSRFNDISSDTESHSSDSETCPKLSKIRQQNQFEALGSTKTSIEMAKPSAIASHPYHGRPLSVSCTNKELQQQKQQSKDKQKDIVRKQQQQQTQEDLLPITDEDRECDFFTKQARLQIEARMALSQAKEMAHMQMEVERQNRRMSPITGVIRNSLEKIGVQMTMDKRRVSRQMLTDMNIAQLQILVNSLHTHIENLNESLVQFLMERDDLHVGQDAMLVDIEELTRYIGAQEHLTNEHKKSTKCNRSK